MARVHAGQRPLGTTSIAWVVGALGSAILPHAPFLPPWVLVLFFVTAIWRVQIAAKHRVLPSRWIRFALAAVGFVMVYSTYRGIDGVLAGSALLVVMVSLKLLETRSRRDLILLLILAYFLVLACFLRNQSLWLAGALGLSVWIITAALLQLSREQTLLSPSEAVRLTGKLLLQSLPLMAVLFLLFPRVPGPFWSLPHASTAGMTGLGEEMTPGSIAELSLSDEVAFRVSFDGPLPDSENLYWRGPVLGRFDGRTWSRDSASQLPVDPGDIQYRGKVVDYTISLEPHGRRWLFGLDMPAGPFPDDAILNRQFQLLTLRPINERLVISLRSYLDYRSTHLLSASYREHLSQLPARSNERSAALARTWRAEARNDRDYISRVLEMFRVQPFVYTLSPLPLDMRNPTDDFLFNTREGFCEYFASAFAVLMRSVGIPARIVTGYQGGELNRLGRYLIVRQSSAHAWVEVWLDDAGWVRVDPTAAVAPERVRLGLSEALREGDPLPGGLLRSNALLSDLRMAWDTVNAGWNNWVLGYGPRLQMEFLSKFGLSAPSAVQLVVAIAVISSLLLGILTLWLASLYRPRANDRALRLYQRFLRRLEAAGLPSMPHEGPSSLAERIATIRPDLAEQVGVITDRYIAARYQRSEGDGAVIALSSSVAKFRPARRLL